MLSVFKQSKWYIAAIIGLIASQAFGHGMSEEEKHIISEGGNLRYIWIGATHMLSGYDHLAFVFGIIFFLTRFKDIVKYITAFTIGHSITLIYATFNSITVNYFLVDAVIALSVCYIAFHNLDGFKKHFSVKSPNMMVMIIAFGLIHGLGLSTRLQQLPLSEDDLFMNIISFNLGIELGQIGALAIMLLVITGFRKSDSFAVFNKIANIFLIFAGGFLFLMQMHGYEHTTNHELAPKVNNAEYIVDHVKTVEVEWTDKVIVTVPARGEIEYKLHLKQDAVLEYAWSTEKGELFFDLHGEPDGDTTGYFISFLKDTKSQSNGSITTVFEGNHGWYWQNDNPFPITVSLSVKGEYQRLDN